MDFNKYKTMQENIDKEFPLIDEKDFIKKQTAETYSEYLENIRKKIMGIEEVFKQDLFEKYGVSDNCKRNKAFEIARNNNKSFPSIEEGFAELVELIK